MCNKRNWYGSVCTCNHVNSCVYAREELGGMLRFYLYVYSETGLVLTVRVKLKVKRAGCVRLVGCQTTR